MEANPGTALTVSQIIGEITWLVTQSPIHQDKRVKELSWILMAPVLKKQFHLFRDGEKPIGVAIWAFTDEAGGRAIASGEFDPEHCSEAAWSSGQTLWLVELIAPFSTPENHHAEMMLADLVSGPLKGLIIKFALFNPTKKVREIVELGDDASVVLAKAIVERLNL